MTRHPSRPKTLRRTVRRFTFKARRNLPLVLAAFGTLLALSLVLPLPALQAFDGLTGEPPASTPAP